MRTETSKADEVITVDHDSSGRREMTEGAKLAFIDDAPLLSELAAVREMLQREPDGKTELAEVYDALTVEMDERATRVWTKNYAPREGSERVDRAPADMST